MAGTDFAKGWIFAALGLSVVGVGAHFVLDHFLTKARTDKGKAYQQLGVVFGLSNDIDTLVREKENDLFRVKAASGRYGEYFQTQAENAGLDMTPNVGKDKTETPRDAKGFIDKSFEITFSKRPGQEKQGFPRNAIGRFLFNVEANTKLLTVSEITLDQANTKDPTEDHWNLRAFVTERRPEAPETATSP